MTNVLKRIRNNAEGLASLCNEIESYYKKNGDRFVYIFDTKLPGEDADIYVRFLMDKQHVIEYSINEDRRMMLGGALLAIGPQYFSPAFFWSFEDGERFRIDTYPDDIEHNLRLMDEFLGYPVKPKFLPWECLPYPKG